MRKRLVSGTQVTGSFHLGNYLGAIKRWVGMQQDYECYFFLADLHSITTLHDAQMLKLDLVRTLAAYLACGLNPEESTIFAQSQVKGHTELAWILNCITPMGWLKRMTQFKEKSNDNRDNANLGLFAYPVLMAADILLYKTDVVPVGEDQKQHLELTRDIALTFNRKFEKEIFPLPEALIDCQSGRIMSLRDGNKKMSKSDDSDFSRINVIDEPNLIKDKIKRAKTDSFNYLSYDKKNRPEISNLLEIFSILSKRNVNDVASSYSSFNVFKSDLADLVIDALSPIRTKYNEYMNNQDYLLEILNRSASKASVVADHTLKEVKNLFGLIT